MAGRLQSGLSPSTGGAKEEHTTSVGDLNGQLSATPDSLPPEEADVGAIGVALSGGGVRAALFSLGVLMYIVRSGLNRQVAMVTSVSGGSITNAAVAAAGDLSKMTAEQFDPICRRLANRLAKQGSFFLPRLRSLVPPVLTLVVLYPIVLMIALWLGGERDMRWMVNNALIIASFALAGFITPLGVRILFRQPTQRRVYRRLLHSVRDEAKRPGNPAFSLDKLADSDVTHVLCATELVSGQPMFFSRDWVYSPTFGWGEARVGADRAVYASAAFPGVFPPLKLPTAPLKMGGGESNRHRPSYLVLADGGVYNNLGNDWFNLAERAATVPFGLDSRFQPPPRIDYQIIVNASSPSKVMPVPKVPLVRKFLMFTRMMTVLYENTLRPRITQLDSQPRHNATVIDIAMSPLELADRAKGGGGSDDRVVRRVDNLRVQLARLSDDYWAELVDETSLLKTTLTSVGNERAARLMRHGYLSAMVALHARFGSSGLEDVPDERAFIELTEGVNAKP